MPNSDPFRALAAACVPLVVTGDVPKKYMDRAIAAMLVVAKDVKDRSHVSENWSAGEQALFNSFHVAQVLTLRHQEVRDLLWAAVKVFGLSRSSAFTDPDPRSTENYWWQDV